MALVEFILTIIGIVFGVMATSWLIDFLCDLCQQSCSRTNHNSNEVKKPELTLDVDRMYKDYTRVNIGELPLSEYKRRERSGYYLVEKGKEYSWIEEQRKKRVEHYINDCWIK